MARVIPLESFAADLETVRSARIYNAILDAVDLLRLFPRRGSTDVPGSVRKRYGDVRKLVIDPYDVIYRYIEKDDVALVLGIVHQRSAY